MKGCIFILTTTLKNNNIAKLSIVGAALAGGLFFATPHANAATKIDDNHVQVVAGDTLSEIAHANNIDVDTLASQNNIKNKNLIHVGDKLVITPGVKAEATVQENTDYANQAVQQAPVANNNQTTNNNNVTSNYSSSVSGSEQAAKEWIANRESGGSYSATNGRYQGRYQLDSSYLNGDYSAANQERVADNYVSSRYGSWTAAQAFWQSHGWY